MFNKLENCVNYLRIDKSDSLIHELNAKYEAASASEQQSNEKIALLESKNAEISHKLSEQMNKCNASKFHSSELGKRQFPFSKGRDVRTW